MQKMIDLPGNLPSVVQRRVKIYFSKPSLKSAEGIYIDVADNRFQCWGQDYSDRY